MYFLPISIAIFLLFLLLIPFLLVVMPAVAFSKLGLSPFSGIAFYFFCLAGSMVNIPVHREELEHVEGPDDIYDIFNRFFGVRVPVVRQRVIALNLGGAVLPGILCLYLFSRIDNTGPVLAATAVTTVFSYLLSRPVKNVGIIMPAFIPPIIAAAAALIFAGRENVPAIAYISGVMGTIIGADLLRLYQIRRFGVSFLSIGGAGVFDGIYMVGIIAVLLA